MPRHVDVLRTRNPAAHPPPSTAHSSTGPAAFINPEGRLELFIRGTDKAVWHKWRTTGPAGKNVSWSDWVSLGGSFRNFPC